MHVRHFRVASPPSVRARSLSRLSVADLCDKHLQLTHPRNDIQVVEPIFTDYGGTPSFSGKVATIECFENNPLVRETLKQPGNGQVLVVDGGGSLR
jgi:regulator of ribonuclease activity A